MITWESDIKFSYYSTVLLHGPMKLLKYSHHSNLFLGFVIIVIYVMLFKSSVTHNCEDKCYVAF